MPDRSRKRPRDLNELASEIVAEGTGEKESDSDENEGKDPNAVALGRKGGKKGGKARAKKLSRSRRQEIAKKAARARWGQGQKA